MAVQEKIAILDCGGQYTKVIDRRVRELEVYSDIFPATVKADELRDYSALILSGGPESVWADNAVMLDPGLFELGVPVLGICYGMHWINKAFGGTVSPDIQPEYGVCKIRTDASCRLFEGLETEQAVLMSHGDCVDHPASGMRAVAWSGGLIVGICNEARKLYGIQFHPEVDLTENGMKILENFLRGVAGLTERYALDDRVESAVAAIRAQAGERNVLVLVSGGVDSAVSAALLLKALDPNKVFAIHIDHGFMRLNESDLICETLKGMGLKNLIRENAADLFYDAPCEIDGSLLGPLTTLIDPEEKRALVGTTFIKAMRRAASQLDIDFDEAYWAQGTLRPDLIESGNPDVSSHARKIKTHHNDVDLVREARDAGRVIETNKDWHKDEVRQVARMLGLGEEIAARQPFPGPGLCVRVMCQTEYPAPTKADQDKLDGVLNGTPLTGRILPLKSVGVQGDARSFGNLAVLRGQSPGGEALAGTARRITNAIPGVNRVAYILGGDAPAELTCLPNTISRENVELLRQIDAMVTSALIDAPVSQCFAILLPLGSGARRYSIAIRAFVTNDFMTGRAALLGKELDPALMSDLAARIRARFPDEIACVLYDITDKPPATCEWQ